MLTAFVATAGAVTDTTAPAVTNVVPANGSTVYTNGGSTVYYQYGNATPLVIRADYSDEAGGSGVDPTSVMVHLDGDNMLNNCPVQTESHVDCNATAADLSAGAHTLDIYVMDNAGHLTVSHTTLTVAVDSQAPTYSNLMPAGGSTIYTSQLNSASTNDPGALRFDYDLTDAAPSSGYSPMSHVNDSVPPGVSGAMIMNSSCVKTPGTNPTHYSCQANRAKLLHLGDNTFSALLKDNVGNKSSNYSDPSSLNHFTVVDDVAPVVSGITADAATLSATYADPAPTGALSTNLTSGINAASVMAKVDGLPVSGCSVTGTGVSCATPTGLSEGTHVIEVMVSDNSGTTGIGTGSLTICTPAKPSLGVSRGAVFWASYADYTAGELTVKLIIKNKGTGTANSVAFTGSTSDKGVTLSTGTPVNLSDLTAGASVEFPVMYHIPTGVSYFKSSVTASAADACGTGYTYP